MRNFAILLLLAATGWADEPLTLRQSVDNALVGNPAIEASKEGVKAATSRASAARGARLPRVDYSESWTRTNNPVYVFGALLDQRQFTAPDFSLGFLNNPPFVNNFQSRIAVDQTLWDGGARGAREHSADLTRQAATEGARGTEIEVIAQTVTAYYDAVLARESVKVADDAVRSAEADLKRAEDRRGAGMATDADVLSIRVHQAAAQEQLIRRQAGAELAMARLDSIMGVSVDSKFDLTTPLGTFATPQAGAETDAEHDAEQNRPETRIARLGASVFDQQVKAAHAAMLPQFFVQGIFEADRQQFYNEGGANWTVAAGLRWNLFNGFSDRAENDAARHDAMQARAGIRQAASQARVEAKRAWLETRSAEQRVDVSKAAIDMAEESLRIIRNRYQAGLTEVTDLLRAETALVEAKTNGLSAARDQRVAAVNVEAARGALNRNSEVVNQ